MIKSLHYQVLDSKSFEVYYMNLFICKEQLAQYKNLKNILLEPGMSKKACYHSPGATPSHMQNNSDSLVMAEHKLNELIHSSAAT